MVSYKMLVSTILVALVAIFHQLLLASCSTVEKPASSTTNHSSTVSIASDLESRVSSNITTTASESGGRLHVNIHNTRADPLYAYITGIDPVTGDYYILQSQGQGQSHATFTWETKPNGTSPIPEYYTVGAPGYQIQLAPGENTTVYLPGYAASGRIYVAEQELRFGTTQGGSNEGFVEPSASNPGLPEYDIAYSFLEFTHLAGSFYADVTNMDFVSIPLGISLRSASPSTGSSSRVQTVPGLVANATALVCRGLEDQARRDGYGWDRLCLYRDSSSRNNSTGKKLTRVLSPTQYLAIHPTDRLATYYDSYVDAVWDRYRRANLTMNTQDSDPADGTGRPVALGSAVSCSVGSGDDDDVLICSHEGPGPGGSSASAQPYYRFAKPTSAQIFGCTQDQDSPFLVAGGGVDRTQAEIVPRLCAAFQRSTLLLPGGDVQPPVDVTAASYYYTGNVTNHYARLVHEHQGEGMGYAFAYDDANPSGPGLDNATANAAGLIKSTDPECLEVTVGG